MANITEILGTDSVSSSRPVINSNFELLNDETASITALLDPTTSTLQSVGLSSISSITLVDGASIASIASGGATFEVDTTFNGALNIGGSLIKNGIVGSPAIPTAQNNPASISASTYFVGNSTTFTLPATGEEGQEVTLINKSAAAVTIQVAIGAALGVTSIELQGAPVINSSVTLRCFGATWYVIGSYSATIA
tara:strand:- start:449 stop:1030 length:582 start_codon:yes stop_codon:yes gene_type:complete